MAPSVIIFHELIWFSWSIRFDSNRYDLKWFDMIWFELIRFDLTRSGLTRCVTHWHGLIWFSILDVGYYVFYVHYQTSLFDFWFSTILFFHIILIPRSTFVAGPNYVGAKKSKPLLCVCFFYFLYRSDFLFNKWFFFCRYLSNCKSRFCPRAKMVRGLITKWK